MARIRPSKGQADFIPSGSLLTGAADTGVDAITRHSYHADSNVVRGLKTWQKGEVMTRFVGFKAIPSIVFLAVTFLICVPVSIGMGREIKMDSPKFSHILRDGAVAKFTLKIVDVDGAAVADANVLASFAMESSKGIEGTCDTNGLFSMKGKSRGEMHYGVRKDGYCPTSTTVKFGRHDGIVVKDGKWQPWNPTNIVILKKIKNPIPMYAVFGKFEIPVKGVPVGLDLEKTDWVAPYGIGINSDVLILYDEVMKDPWTGKKSLLLTFGSNVFEGVQSAKLDACSEYHSQYEAPTDGYTRSLKWEFERTQNKILTDNKPSDDEYFIFRVRAETDEKGNLIRACYGKLYGPVEYGLRGGKAVLRMSCYFNPEVNSRNLEFDREKNLSGQKVHIP
jgi:hypothetical protein